MLKRKIYAIFFIFLVTFLITGCAAVKATGKALGTVGKITVFTVKTTGKVVGKTASVTGKGIKTVVNMVAGKHLIKLHKKGNSLLIDTLLNRKIKTRLILDTGCTDTQISEEVASKLGIDSSRCKTVLCQMADGRSVSGKEVNIREIRVGRAKVYNVRAIVLGSDKVGSGGLLGMSFLDNFVFKIDSEKGELTLQKRI